MEKFSNKASSVVEKSFIFILNNGGDACRLSFKQSSSIFLKVFGLDILVESRLS